MLVKDFIGRLNSYNMDAGLEFADGNDFEIEITNNKARTITDEGNTEKVIFKVITKEPEPTPTLPIPEDKTTDNSENSNSKDATTPNNNGDSTKNSQTLNISA